MPKTIIAANWKMSKTIPEAQNFIAHLKNLKIKDGREAVICAPFTALSSLETRSTCLPVGKVASLHLAGQNMHYEKSGAYTGEISAEMLKDAGCNYVLLGHSERRQLFAETNKIVNKKIKAALEADLKIIFCVGETLAEREKNQTENVVTTQISEGLENLNLKTCTLNLIIAYEPVWAIGTGKTATPEQAQEVHAIIRNLVGPDISILYGGSVKPDNIKALMAQKDINGALVGGASLKFEDFEKIINF